MVPDGNAQTWAANSDSDNRSRRGWKWLYEQKCEQWELWVKGARHFQVVCKVCEINAEEDQRIITEERGLRDGWEQTAGELQAEVDRLNASLSIEIFDRGGLVAVNESLQAQVKQSDGNTQRVEAERDEALQRLDLALANINEFLRQIEIKEATVERLEAEVKRLARNDQRDEMGRYIKWDK